MLPFFRQVASALAVYCENQLVLHKARMDARLEGVSLEQARIAAQLESEGISPLLELREYIEESAGKVAQGYSASRAVRELTGEGAQAIDQAIQGVRRLVATDDMTAPQLSEELEKVVLATESQAGVPILWGAFGQPADLPGYLRHAICDTVGEMLNYLCTQGQPRQLRVLLDANSERLKVEVEEIGARAAHDSGARRPSAARRPQHLQALARQFGGQIDYASSAQWGTRLTLRVPLVEVGEWRQGTDSAPAATAISPEHLSPREAEILTLISQGLTNDGISRDLSIKLGTVRWHVSNILAKLDARNRTDAVRIARERHLIQE